MMEPQYVGGAATWVGTRIQKSSQSTRLRADNVGIRKAEKKKKTAHRSSLSLDKGSPHKCWARVVGEMGRRPPYPSAQLPLRQWTKSPRLPLSVVCLGRRRPATPRAPPEGRLRL